MSIKSYTNLEFRKDLKKLKNLIKTHMIQNGGESHIDELKGGKKSPDDKREYRNFSVCRINGKDLNKKVGKYKITSITSKGEKSTAGPSDAAHKAAISLVRKNEENMLKNNNTTTLSIVEVTRGSKKKVYGPYRIIIKKLSSSEYAKKVKDFKKKLKSFKKKPKSFKPKKYNVSVEPVSQSDDK